jgi:predicted chitinase
MSPTTPIRLLDLFRYYKRLGHQDAAIQELEQLINKSAPGLLARDQDWYSTWSSAVEAPAPQWPLTKAELGQIMLCKPEALPDDLMDDLARCCEVFKIDTRTELAHFLGQCGHESAGLRYPVEIHSGSNYEGRQDLGNVHPGDGVKFAGTGWLQCTGRYNHQRFSDYLSSIGRPDPKVMSLGKTYTSEAYPWTISGFWWHDNKMKRLIQQGASVDQVGARVNGRMPPNGAQDRRDYTARAFKVLGV